MSASAVVESRHVASPDQLNGWLRTLVVPLALRAPRRAPVVAPEVPTPHSALFAAGQIRELARTWRQHTDSRLGDVGFGDAVPVLEATHVIDGPPVEFGASRATYEEELDSPERLADLVWRVQPAVVIGLWHTIEGYVLTVERLERRPNDIAAEIRREPSSRDVTDYLDRMLRGTRWTNDVDDQRSAWDVLTLRALFGVHRPSHNGISSRQWRSPIGQLRIPSVEMVRGRATNEGLLVATASVADDAVKSLVSGRGSDEDERTERAQAAGVSRTWESASVVSEPGEPGSMIAVRDDFRSVLWNLEAQSIRHDYRSGALGAAIPLVLPVVSLRAASAGEYHRLAEATLSSKTPRVRLKQQVDAIEAIRSGSLARRLRQERWSRERFREWSVPSALASLVHEGIADEVAEVRASATDAADVVQSSIDRQREDTRSVVETVGWVVGPLIFASTLVGCYAALSDVPSPNGEGPVFESVPDALWLTAGVTFGALLFGAAIVAAIRSRRQR